MTRIFGGWRPLAVAAVAFSLISLLVPYAHGQTSIDPIIAIANATACSGTPPGGTICSNGTGGLEGTGGTPFSLKGIENGSITLQAVIGTQTSPVYEVVNDTGSTANTITFAFTGSLASNEFLNCQTNGAFSGASCTVTPTPGGTPAGCTSTDSNPTNTQDNPCLPVTFTFTGLGISKNSDFDITFASFGNGASGQTIVTPEPATLVLFGTGLFGIVGFARRKFNS